MSNSLLDSDEDTFFKSHSSQNHKPIPAANKTTTSFRSKFLGLSKESTNIKPSGSEEVLLRCPLCPKTFVNSSAHISHLKQCAKRKKLSTKQLLDLLKKNTDVDNIGEKEKKNGQLLIKSAFEDALNIAINQSLCDNPRSNISNIPAVVKAQKVTLERFGFTSSGLRRHKGGRGKIITLKTRTPAEREKLLTEKAAAVLLDDDVSPANFKNYFVESQNNPLWEMSKGLERSSWNVSPLKSHLNNKKWHFSVKPMGRLSDDWSQMVNNPLESDLCLKTSDDSVFFAHRLVIKVRCPEILAHLEEKSRLCDFRMLLDFFNFVYTGVTVRESLAAIEEASAIFSCPAVVKSAKEFLTKTAVADCEFENDSNPGSSIMFEREKIRCSNQKLDKNKLKEEEEECLSKKLEESNELETNLSNNYSRALFDIDDKDEDERKNNASGYFHLFNNNNLSLQHISSTPSLKLNRQDQMDDIICLSSDSEEQKNFSDPPPFDDNFDYYATPFESSRAAVLSETLNHTSPPARCSTPLRHETSAVKRERRSLTISHHRSKLLQRSINIISSRKRQESELLTKSIVACLEKTFDFGYQTPCRSDKNTEMPMPKLTPGIELRDEITPKPNFSTMKTALLKKHLQQYGLKKSLSKNKAKKILNHIYEELHPMVDMETGQIVKASQQADRPSQNDKSLEEFEFLDTTSQANSQTTTQKVKKGNLDELKQNFKLLLKNDCDLRVKILLYEPVSIEFLRSQIMNKFSLRYSLPELMDFLDSECIIFRSDTQRLQIKDRNEKRQRKNCLKKKAG